MAITLKTINASILEGNEDLEKLNDNFSAWFELQKRNRLDMLEERREQRKLMKRGATAGTKGKDGSNAFGFGTGLGMGNFFANLGRNTAVVTAGVTSAVVGSKVLSSSMKKSIAKTQAAKELEIAKLQKANDIVKAKRLIAESDVENKRLTKALNQQKLLKIAPELDEIKRLNKNTSNKLTAGKTNQVLRAPFLGPEFDVKNQPIKYNPNYEISADGKKVRVVNIDGSTGRYVGVSTKMGKAIIASGGQMSFDFTRNAFPNQAAKIVPKVAAPFTSTVPEGRGINARVPQVDPNMRTTTTLPKTVLGQLGSSVDDIAQASKISMKNQMSQFARRASNVGTLTGGALKTALAIADMPFNAAIQSGLKLQASNNVIARSSGKVLANAARFLGSAPAAALLVYFSGMRLADGTPGGQPLTSEFSNMLDTMKKGVPVQQAKEAANAFIKVFKANGGAGNSGEQNLGEVMLTLHPFTNETFIPFYKQMYAFLNPNKPPLTNIRLNANDTIGSTGLSSYMAFRTGAKDFGFGVTRGEMFVNPATMDGMRIRPGTKTSPLFFNQNMSQKLSNVSALSASAMNNGPAGGAVGSTNIVGGDTIDNSTQTVNQNTIAPPVIITIDTNPRYGYESGMDRLQSLPAFLR